MKKDAPGSKIRAKWRYVVCVAITLVAVFLTVVVFRANRDWERSVIKSDFDLNALHCYETIRSQTESDLHVLEALSAFYASSEVVTRHEFRRFAGSFLSHHPDIKMLEWVPRVPSYERTRYEEAARKDGLRDFLFKKMIRWERTLSSTSPPEYFPVYFVAPQAGNEDMLGSDLASDPLLMKSMTEARDSGRMAAVFSPWPGHGKSRPDGIFVIDPIYRKSAAVDSVGLRRKYLLGFAAGMFMTGSIVQNSFTGDKPLGLNIFLYKKVAGGNDRLVYTYRPDSRKPDLRQLAGTAYAAWRHTSGDIEFARGLGFAGQELLVKIIPTREYIAERMTWQPWQVLFAGLLCSGLLGAYLLLTVRSAEEALISNERLQDEIEERRKSGKALLMAAREWRRTFDAMSEGISIHDMDMNVMRANKALCSLLETEEDKLVGVKCHELLHHLPHPITDCPMQKVALTSRPESAEIFEPSLNRWFFVSCFPLLDTDSHMTGIVHTVRDISDRKDAEEKIKRLNRLYTVLNEINKLIVRARNRQDLFENVCRIAVEYGLFRMAWIAVIDKEDGSLVPAVWYGDEGGYVYAVKGLTAEKGEGSTAIAEAVESREHYICNDIEELRGLSHWGSEALKRGFLSVAAFPFRQDGFVIGGMAFFSGKQDFFDNEEIGLLDELAEDVSFALDGMAKEESRRKAEALTGSILESVDEGFLIIDRNYLVVTANRAYSEMVGMPIEEIVGKSCHSSSHDSDRPCHELGMGCPVKHTLETGETYRVIHTHFDRKGNALHLEIKAFPIKDPSGNVVSAIETVNDISETRRLAGQLQQAQKMEAVGRFAGGIAHDFNNILSAIMGYAHLLRMRTDVDAVLQENVEQILESAERAASLTHGLLAFSRKQILSPQPVNLNRIVSQVERLLLRLLGEDIEISTSLAKDALTVIADSGQIEQVLMNLATNARDAMPKGGSFFISTGTTELDADFIRARGHGAPGLYALLCVTDSGMGMDKATGEKIFEPFFTTKEPGKGTGLGLAMVYGTIRQHNGFIDVHSEEGKGTTFRIYLPMAVDKEHAKEEADVVAPLKGGTETILLAEDDAVLRKLYSTVLSEFGYKVLTAGDGDAAMSAFKDHIGDIRLVVLDVIMPKKNGGEVLREIRETDTHIKAIFISGYTGEVIDRTGITEEGVKLLHKPLSPRDLVVKVREMLDG